MANEIGVIKVILGTVTATAADGSVRVLHVGDKISAFDLISTGLNGAVEIEFNDGSIMDLGRNSQIFLDDAFLAAIENVTNEVELTEAEMQAAILAGEDPTEVSQPTAAGANPILSDDGHSSVFVEFQSEGIFPETGFETERHEIQRPVNQPSEAELLNVNSENAGLASTEETSLVPTSQDQPKDTGQDQPKDIDDTPEDDSKTLDTPVLHIGIADQSTISNTINIDNVKDVGSGFTVEAKDINGGTTEVSQVITRNGKVQGFGVAGGACKEGDASVLQQVDGKSEMLIVTFDTPVNDVRISFSWLSKVESAHYVLKDIHGNVIGEGTVTGVTDKIDDAISVAGQLIASIEFTAPGELGGGSFRDDYLINQISYTTGTITPLTISVELAELTENITAILVEVPEQAVLPVGTLLSTQDGISTWSLPLSSTDDYTINIDQATGVMSISGLSIVTPSTFTEILTVSTSVSIAGAGQSAEGVAITKIGTTEDDTIVGSDANDTLLGNMGNDILSAGDGDDILSGGLGDDTLSGGSGKDLFIWSNGDQGTVDAPAVDRLTDFSTEDTLNLADLLVDEESNNLFDYITIAQQGNDVVLSVSPDGSGEVSQSIVLENTSLDELGLTGPSQAELLQQMIDNGQLHVDQ